MWDLNKVFVKEYDRYEQIKQVYQKRLDELSITQLHQNQIDERSLCKDGIKRMQIFQRTILDAFEVVGLDINMYREIMSYEISNSSVQCDNYVDSSKEE